MVTDVKKRAVVATGAVTKDLQTLEAAKVKSDVSSLKNEMLALKTLVAQLSSATGSTALATVTSEIAQIKSDLAGQYQTDITNLFQQLSSDGTSITGFSSAIQGALASIQTLSNTIATNGNVLGQVQSMISSLSSFLAPLMASNPNIAADIQGIQSIITINTTSIAALKASILADETNHKVASVAKNYFYLGRMLRMDWLRKNLIALPENNKWQALSRSALLADGYGLYSGLIKDAMNSAPDSDNFAVSWLAKEQSKVKLLNDMFDELQSYKTLDLAMLSAAVREIGTIFA